MQGAEFPMASADQPGSEVNIHTARSPCLESPCLGSLGLDRRSALFLDIDGTLLELAERPDAARPDRAVTRLLPALREALGGAFALVTGRSISDVDRLFAPLRLAAGGKHGAELRLNPDADPIEIETAAIGDRIRRAVSEIARAHPQVIVEDKGASIALHYRRAPEIAAGVGRRLQAALAADGAGLCLQPGRKVWEIKSAACSKATAVRALMACTPFSGRRPVFVGDDISDEDGFAEVERGGGLAFAVAGEQESGRAPTFAAPAAVRRWLSELPDRINP